MMIRSVMRKKALIICNASQVPFNNNLLPVVRAFRRVAGCRLLEPYRLEGFVPTGGAAPAEVPEKAARNAIQGFEPDLVVCVGGGLYLSRETRSHFPKKTVFIGIALSDPIGLDASLRIASEFELFYTQDPGSAKIYFEQGIQVKRCDLAVDTDMFHPMEVERDCDIIFFGKWSPYRGQMLHLLASHFKVRLHAHANQGEKWNIPSFPPLNSPADLSEAVCRSRIALELALMDDAPAPFTNKWRITPRPFFAAACGVPSLIEYSERLHEFFEPGVEIEAFRSPEELPERVGLLLKNEERLRKMSSQALLRVKKDHTWDLRVQMILEDVRNCRKIV